MIGKLPLILELLKDGKNSWKVKRFKKKIARRTRKVKNRALKKTVKKKKNKK